MITQKKIKFASIQSQYARTLTKQLGVEITAENPETVLFFDGNRVWQYSSAVVRLLWVMGGLNRLKGWLLWFVPLFFRDFIYQKVADSRSRSQHCVVNAYEIPVEYQKQFIEY